MTEYKYTLPQAVLDRPYISGEDAAVLAQSWAESGGLSFSLLNLELHIHFIAVFRFEIQDVEDAERVTGWLVGGNMPHLSLIDARISNPIEALAIYAHLSTLWCLLEGRALQDEPVATFLLPPDWREMSFDAEDLEDFPLGAYNSYIAFVLLPLNKQHMHNVEILALCRQHGWLMPQNE